MIDADVVAGWLDWIVRLVNFAALLIGAWALLRHFWKRRVVRKFFGGHEVTVWIPTRLLPTSQEARTSVDRADLAALQALQRFLEKYDVKVNYDYIGTEGELPLWGGGNIVVGGPKMSKTIAAGMGHDPNVRFTKLDEEGELWGLKDLVKEKEYRSPRDNGSAEDFGYLGRLCKPDMPQHTFLSVAGVHGPGSAIAAEHLCDYHVVRQLYRRFSCDAFSGIVAGTYQRNPLRVSTSEEIVMRRWADVENTDVTPVGTPQDA